MDVILSVLRVPGRCQEILLAGGDKRQRNRGWSDEKK